MAPKKLSGYELALAWSELTICSESLTKAAKAQDYVAANVSATNVRTKLDKIAAHGAAVTIEVGTAKKEIQLEKDATAIRQFVEGVKIVLKHDEYGPLFSLGAIGTIAESHLNTPANKLDYCIVTFSGERQLSLRVDEMRLAAPGEIAADAADPDLDEKFTGSGSYLYEAKDDNAATVAAKALRTAPYYKSCWTNGKRVMIDSKEYDDLDALQITELGQVCADAIAADAKRQG
jgi:autotransporter translocation and assembly factor TamB